MLNFFRENETVYMVMNYCRATPCKISSSRRVTSKRDKVFRESTIRSLFDEILRGLRIVHQHKMLHLDIKPPTSSSPTTTGRCCSTLAPRAGAVQRGTVRPMYTPGSLRPKCIAAMVVPSGPWTDIYAIGACIYACMQGYPPTTRPSGWKDPEPVAVAPAQCLL